MSRQLHNVTLALGLLRDEGLLDHPVSPEGECSPVPWRPARAWAAACVGVRWQGVGVLLLLGVSGSRVLAKASCGGAVLAPGFYPPVVEGSWGDPGGPGPGGGLSSAVRPGGRAAPRSAVGGGRSGGEGRGPDMTRGSPS